MEHSREHTLINNFINRDQYKRSVTFSVWLQTGYAFILLATAFLFVLLYPERKVWVLIIASMVILRFFIKNKTKYYREDTDDVFLYYYCKKIVLELRIYKNKSKEEAKEKAENEAKEENEENEEA